MLETENYLISTKLFVQLLGAIYFLPLGRFYFKLGD
jgi:hypothetical protein